MNDLRPMTEGEARAALTMFRLALKYVRVELRGWDYQGKQARRTLIQGIDTIEQTLNEVLAKPEGDGSGLDSSIKYLTELVAKMETELAEIES